VQPEAVKAVCWAIKATTRSPTATVVAVFRVMALLARILAPLEAPVPPALRSPKAIYHIANEEN
jgi:hypothetical protein